MENKDETNPYEYMMSILNKDSEYEELTKINKQIEENRLKFLKNKQKFDELMEKLREE